MGMKMTVGRGVYKETEDQTMGIINREDMLELTRRMTVKRNCFARIAGAYLDEEGYIDGTFNQHFLNLTSSERDKNIKLAKAVPFAATNVQLKEYPYRRQDVTDDSMRKLLLSLNQSELKNDALLEMLYEEAGEYFHKSGGCAVYVFYGGYDIPRKGTDGGLSVGGGLRAGRAGMWISLSGISEPEQ